MEEIKQNAGGMQLGEWLAGLASKAPVPGGGGACAVGGALAAALGQMVASLTVGKKRYADVEEEMRGYLGELGRLQAELLCLVDQDAEVFAPLAAAYGMPKDTEEERAEKERVMEERLLMASMVPLRIMEKAKQVLDVVEQLERKGSRLAVSDAGVAAQFAQAAILGAAMNVYINTNSMKNRGRAQALNDQADKLSRDGVSQASAVYQRVLKKLTTYTREC